jgi:hypothetical protein
MHQAHFPRDAFSTAALSNVAQEVGATQVKSPWIYVCGGAADETIIFRRPSAGAEYFRLTVPSGSNFSISKGYDFVDGLEVLTDTAAGDVNLVVAKVSL